MPQPEVALQLYTVRDALSRDFEGTLKRVKTVGYDVVQLSGSVPLEAAPMRDLLRSLGLRVAGIHVALDQLEARLDHWIAYAQTVGTRDLVCPFLPEARRKAKADWLATAALLDRLGERCRRQEARLSYHNHSFEFVKLDGQFALDLLYEHTSPENVYAELDTYWVKHGGEDPVTYIQRYAGREPLLHVKDMASDEKRSFAEIGRGTLDWPAIHEAASRAGVECYCVEQDTCSGDPLDSARISLRYLRRLLRD